jgi:hypothetical protein
MAALPLERHPVHGAWNYTLRPQPATDTQAPAVSEAGGPAQRRQAVLGLLADPRLTGMSTDQLQQLAARLAPPRLSAPRNDTAISAEAGPAAPPENSASHPCSTMPRVCCSPSSTNGRPAP